MNKHHVLLGSAILAVALCVVPASAQVAVPAAQPSTTTEQDIQLLRENIRADRKKIMAANMVLTSDQATKFWPIYDQYQAELNKIGDTRWQWMKEYAASYPNVTPEQAQGFMARSTQVDQQMIALREKYVPILEKVISPKQVALWYQIDRQIDLIVNVQLASLLPLVDPTK
ncbi:MAG TPA: hypothetical protein VK702_13185 [Candidatus Acidoferrum sp.]|jgi:hypothetical protein|nr:hypothetical protein [Candidatus Acidoferrum sp.]